MHRDRAGTIVAVESMPMDNLLERLGGRDGLAIVVSGLVARLSADPRLANKFDRHTRAHQEEYILTYSAVLLDGDHAPGLERDLAALHLRLQFGEEALAVFLDYLTETLTAAGVGSSLSRQILMQIACTSWPQIR